MKTLMEIIRTLCPQNFEEWLTAIAGTIFFIALAVIGGIQ